MRNTERTISFLREANPTLNLVSDALYRKSVSSLTSGPNKAKGLQQCYMYTTMLHVNM